MQRPTLFAMPERTAQSGTRQATALDKLDQVHVKRRDQVPWRHCLDRKIHQAGRYVRKWWPDTRSTCVSNWWRADQNAAGGARDCAEFQIGRGDDDWKKRKGKASWLVLSGIANPVLGSNAKVPAWEEQNGQCSNWIESCAGASWLALLTKFVLPTLQISAQGASRFPENAWEIDGASAENSIAKHAIQTAIWRVIFFIPMLKLYQRL